jgi:predicted Zn-dependent peptidase
MPNRLHHDFFTVDTLSDALGRDKSSSLYLSLKKGQNLVSDIGAYITGSIDEGLLVISGKLNDGVSFDDFDQALWKELDDFKSRAISADDLEKIMNKIRTAKEFEDMGILNRAMNLCSYELLGDVSLINKESEIYHNITADNIQRVAKSILQKSSCSLLKVKAK